MIHTMLSATLDVTITCRWFQYLKVAFCLTVPFAPFSSSLSSYVLMIHYSCFHGISRPRAVAHYIQYMPLYLAMVLIVDLVVYDHNPELKCSVCISTVQAEWRTAAHY